MFSSLSPPTPEESALLAQGLSLSGAPLEAPRFQKVPWTEGQVFHSHDDPDRCAEPTAMPGFLLRKDPMEQRRKTAVEEVPLPMRVTASGSFARVVHGALDEEDCKALISCINVKGYTPALLNIGKGTQRFDPHVRNGFRAVVDSPELAAWLFTVVQPYLPQEMEGKPLMDLNERCRILCYTPGQRFGAHHDGLYERPSGGESRVTLQVYLHDVPVVHGGATRFLLGSEKEHVSYQPGAGSVLIFSQDLYHEGSQLHAGLKYTMRTEAMYGKRSTRLRCPSFDEMMGA